MTSTLIPSSEFRSLFLKGKPFIDVRAEVEFARGAFPGACNLPILATEERARVGTTYKHRGRKAAVTLGHELVQGKLKSSRVEAWCQFARGHPDTHVYCWRGGMRSNLAAQWMAEAGCDVPVIEGGFKAMRRYLMDVTERVARERTLVVVGGQTGAAKTPLVRELASGIDLEQHAYHRGSSFGRHATPPPCQIDFEHRLAIDLLRCTDAHPGATLFLEDESHRIGAVSMPLELFRAMGKAPLVIVEMPLSFRIQRIYQEYVVELWREYEALDLPDGRQRYQLHLLGSLDRIKNRLGLARCAELRQWMQQALDTGEQCLHEAWIRRLLVDYYDPMYEYQLGRSAPRVVFRGDYRAVLDWCRNRAISG